MTFWYDKSGLDLAKGDLDLDTAVLKVMLVDADSSADSEKGVVTLSGFADLSEADGANYVRKTLANVQIATVANQVRITADPTSWSALGANVSGENIKGAIIYREIGGGTDAENIPLAWYDGGGFPLTPSGTTVDVTWDVTGALRLDLVES